jgi:hypothetical protein
MLLGMYLLRDDATRAGRLMLYDAAAPASLQLRQTIEMDGVLDLKW